MLSLVLPTYNEASNLPDLIEEIEEALGDIPFEVIVVDDDSPDRTWEIAEHLGNFVRVIRRVRRRGLSSAVVEGLQSAEGTVLAVMDSDRQHDPQVLPGLYKAVREGAAVAIGSRYVPGGSVEGFAKPRHFMSRVATALSWLVTPKRVRDPMSGFFALDRAVFRQIQGNLRPRGFKILLEILSHLPRRARVTELPLRFRARRSGESKLDVRVQREFLLQIARLFLRNRQGLVFALTTLMIALLLLWRIVMIGAIYVHPSVRSEVERLLLTLAEERGWLLSDLLLERVTEDGVIITHRTHTRGPDVTECYAYVFGDPDIHPCDSL